MLIIMKKSLRSNSGWKYSLFNFWKWIHNTGGFVYDSVRENKEKGVKIVWFGVSKRGPKLKTTLHRDLLLMVDNYTLSLLQTKLEEKKHCF